MAKPMFPVKFGLFLKTSLKEYEHFVAHIVDTSGVDNEITQYEIPIALMVNNNIRNRLVQAQVSD